MNNKFSSFFSWFVNRPKVIGFILFIIIFSIFTYIVYQEYSLAKESEKEKEKQVLTIVKQNIEQSLKTSYVSALTLALTIDDEGKPKNFEKVSEKIISSSVIISGVELVPNGIISYVYPYEENKGALGLNVLKHPVSQKEANKSINSGKMDFAGPIPFKQGGKGIIGRMPVFIENQFWGFSAIIIREKDFLSNAGIYKFSKEGFKFRLAKADEETSKETLFFGAKEDFNVNEAQKSFVKDGNWNIYIYSENKENLLISLLPLMFLALLLSILISTFIVRFLKQPRELQRKVNIQAAKLLNSELKFKAIFDRAPIGIVHVEAESYKFIEANQKFLRKTGLSLEEITEARFDSVWKNSKDLKKLVEKGEKINSVFLKKNGTQIDVRVAVDYLKYIDKDTYIFIIEDITEINKAQNHLKELETRVKMAVEIAQLGYWEWNIHTNEVIWSPMMYEIFRISNDFKITPDFIVSRIHHLDAKRYVDSIRSLVNGENVNPSYEAKILDPEGNPIHVLGHLESEKGKLGEVIKIKGTLVDISSEKRTKEELDQSYDVVLQQNKRLINFSYIVSHNLRSHSSNIKSLSHLLLEMEHTQEQEEMFSMLNSVSHALDDTLFDLNDVINIQQNISISIEDILVVKYIERVLEVLKVEIIQKKADIIVNVPSETKISSNPAYFESILLNFISNAIKYRHPNRPPIVIIDFLIIENHPVIQIKDNGIGIDLKKNGDKLFGMYKTFTKNNESRGLGLFISKSQMEALGGKILVQSKLNKGSVFKLFFK